MSKVSEESKPTIEIEFILDEEVSMSEQENKHIFKIVLKNGMTILVRVVKSIPKVSLQIWYNVGSKDEKSGERGIAHLIEHMIFKGTKKLSESDINTVAHMLSGSINAFTSYDYTGYLFNFPKHNWREALPIMADAMENVRFDQEMLNSEMKAVIQELKMYKDNYHMTLIEDMISTIFPDHPYHYPIIGYKQDLWTVKSEDLKKFYKKHYWPNNATLVVVGDVEPEEVFALAEKNFADIPGNPDYKKDEFYHNKDIIAKSVTLYRDVKQPLALLAWMVPGFETKNNATFEVLSWILGSGKGSRLYKKIVDELHLATSLGIFYEDLFEHGLFFIYFEPKHVSDIPKIEQIIFDEIENILEKGLTEKEVTRAIKKTQMKQYKLLESMESQAYELGKFFVAHGDPEYLYEYLNQPVDSIKASIMRTLKDSFRKSISHKGVVLPLPEKEKVQWALLQQMSDEEDQQFLSARPRTTPIEPPSYAKQVKINKPIGFAFPKPKNLKLSNGLNVYYYHNDNTPKIDLVMRFTAQSFYDPEDTQGLYSFVASMLPEGTKKYTAAQLTDELESRGMSLAIYPGGLTMSMLSEDFEFGLELFEEILSNPRFDKKEMEKVRQQLLVDLRNFWDEPKTFAGQLIRQEIYKGHPYSKNVFGTEESIKKIGKKDLAKFHNKYISPQGTTLAIVGDIKNYDIKKVLEKTLAKWDGPKVEKLKFPKLPKSKDDIFEYPISRDQIVLAFAGSSVDRKDPDYDKLFIFDQIFGGGVLGSMASRLFDLREQTGLFYTINGSLTAGANEQPGMVFVKTIVSKDRLNEAETVIKKTINTSANSIEEKEFEDAKNAIGNSLINFFETNRGMANVFIFLDRYNFPADYFDKRYKELQKYTIKDVQDAVKKHLNSERMVTLRIGRVGKDENNNNK